MLIWPVDLRMYRRWSQKCGSAVGRQNDACKDAHFKALNTLMCCLRPPGGSLASKDVAYRRRTIDFAETHKITPEEKHTGHGLFSNYGAKARYTADELKADIHIQKQVLSHWHLRTV